MGGWLSWESIGFALRRSRVQVPSRPLSPKLSQKGERRFAVRAVSDLRRAESERDVFAARTFEHRIASANFAERRRVFRSGPIAGQKAEGH